MLHRDNRILLLLLTILSAMILVVDGASLPTNDSIVDNIKTGKIGRKERCRHVVRKEVQKYSNHVQTLTNIIYSLQQDALLTRRQQEKQSLEMELLRSNLTDQRNLLFNTLERIELLQKQIKNSTQKREATTYRPLSGLPKDCNEIYTSGGLRFPGTYEMMIQPKVTSKAFKVLCEPINEAGWIVIQHRFDGSENFRRPWHEYKKGFGKLQSEFWLGNEHIHHITAKGSTTLRVELEEFSGKKHWAEYSQFKIDNEASDYTVHVSSYSGNAGDSLSSINGQKFSTLDKDHDKAVFDNCAHQYSGGWWYKMCDNSNINGQYLEESTHSSFLENHGIVWPTIHSYKTLKSTRLLLKPTASDID